MLIFFKKTKRVLKLLPFVIVFLSPLSLYAQVPDCPAGKLCNPLKAQSIQQLVSDILDIVVALGVPLVIFFIIYTGFLFATARGSVDVLDRAKKSLLYTLIGGLILLGAQGLSKVICTTVDQVSGQSTCQ